MADNFGIYNLTAELESAPTSSIYGALAPPSGNINLRRKPERDQRDQNELDLARGSNVHVFVLPEVSSSQHEVTSQNAFRSGTVALESTDVPASGNLYYTKRQRFIKMTYSVTASAGLPITPANETSPATDEYAARATFLPGSGSYRNNTVFNPSVIEIDVPDYGKIRDIRVWVEFIHDHRGGTGSGSFAGNPFLAGGSGSANQYPKQGLQGVQVALRSPNVSFDFSHPLWNNNTIKGFEKWPTTQVNAPYRKVPELLKNSYLLWAGHSCEEDLGYALGSQTGSNPTYLPSSPYNIRDITSSSIGPGIGLAVDDTYSTPIYTLFGFRPAFRTLSCVPVGGTSMGVLYPTLYGTNPTQSGSAVFFLVDNGTNSVIDPSPQMFFSSSAPGSVAPFPPSHPFLDSLFTFSMNSMRIRAQKNAPYLHAACMASQWEYGTGIVYGIRQTGDPGAFPWTLRWPVLHGSPTTDVFIPLGADCFFDMAIDSRGGAHFVQNQWRGDLGGDVLNYAVLSGPATSIAYTPPGTTLAGGGYPYYAYFKSQTMTLTAPVTAGQLVTVNVDDTRNYVEGLQVQFLSGTGQTDIANIVQIISQTSLKVDLLTNSYGAAGTALNAWGAGTKMWTASGSTFTMGEMDNPFLNNPRDDSTPAGSVGPYCQIQIDNNDMIHVVYTDIQNKSVKYAKKPVAYTTWTGSWSFELVNRHDATATWPIWISMEVDRQNNPHLAYTIFENGTDNLYYAHSGSGGWVTKKIDTVSGVKIGTTLKLDNNDLPIIASTISNFDGSGNESVVLYTSSSFAGWARRGLYYNKTDNPRNLTVGIDNNNLIRVYSGGGRLTGIWETYQPQQGKYNEFNTDIDMRTIFADSSKNLNPRDLSWAYSSPSESSPNKSDIYGTAILESRAYSSPFSASIRLLESAGVWGPAASQIFKPTIDQANHLSGSNCPWFFDDRVPPGIFKGLTYQTVISASTTLAPPAGWLSGPGATANANEYPTYGSNIGPGTIRPVYPILEDVYVEKVVDQPYLTANAQILPSNHNKLVGYRPGLRGTEMHGKWKLLIGTAGDVSGGNVVANPRAGVWFRQVRIEFVVDQGTGLKNTYASKAYRFAKSGNPLREGKRRVQIMSGSSAWDVGINYVFTEVKDQYGTSHGITDMTSSDKFAVFSQLTGSIVGLLSESGGIYQVRQSYLNNEFGTPYIPISSGSGYLPSFDTFDVSEAKESREIFAATLNPKTLIPKDNTLKAHLTRANVLKTTRDVILSKVKLLK